MFLKQPIYPKDEFVGVERLLHVVTCPFEHRKLDIPLAAPCGQHENGRLTEAHGASHLTQDQDATFLRHVAVKDDQIWSPGFNHLHHVCAVDEKADSVPSGIQGFDRNFGDKIIIFRHDYPGQVRLRARSGPSDGRSNAL
jgi:hypothetical protein